MHSPLGAHGGELGVGAQRGDVVDDRRARRRAPPRRPPPSTCRSRSAPAPPVRERRDHRLDALELARRSPPRRPAASTRRRCRADRAPVGRPARARARSRAGIEEQAAVGERVGRHVDDPHQPRPSGVRGGHWARIKLPSGSSSTKWLATPERNRRHWFAGWSSTGVRDRGPRPRPSRRGRPTVRRYTALDRGQDRAHGLERLLGGVDRPRALILADAAPAAAEGHRRGDDADDERGAAHPVSIAARGRAGSRPRATVPLAPRRTSGSSAAKPRSRGHRCSDRA